MVDYVDDGCWRRNVLVTTLRCWWRFCHFRHQHPLSFNLSARHQHQKMSPISQFCHQHPKIVTNTKSLTSDNWHLLTKIKGGKGRTGTCIATWMLATDFLKTADLALRHFGERRTDEKKGDAFQGVETPSQILISIEIFKMLEENWNIE